MPVLTATARATTGWEPTAWPGTRLSSAPIVFSPPAAGLLVNAPAPARTARMPPKPANIRDRFPADEINTPNQREIMQLTSLTCKLCIAAGQRNDSGSPVGKSVYDPFVQKLLQVGQR